jgi:hypothetical protein
VSAAPRRARAKSHTGPREEFLRAYTPLSRCGAKKNSERITLIVCSGSGRQTERADDKSISGAAHLTLTRFAQDQDKTGANLEAITREREPL